jgi:hypothetical protein
MDKQLLKRLKHTASHSLCTGQDGYGDKTFAATVNRKCYREGKITLVKNTFGEDVISELRLYFDGLFPITGNDEIIFDGKKYRVQAFSKFDGLKEGTGTTVVYL